MSATWHFHKRRPDDPPVVEPTQEQFFSQDALAKSVKALIREGIQNAIDAKAGKNRVGVRIALMRRGLTCERAVANRIFTPEIWRHIAATKHNGLLSDNIPKHNEPCDYLVFEDFGTTGLTGDVRQYVPHDDADSNFFSFFRATGSTDKRGNKLGKWGIGKHTFWMASKIKTVLGFTVRETGTPKVALMGRTILKSHALGDSPTRDYQDGYYGIKQADNGMVLPLSESDEDAISLFRKTFNLYRTTEPGLSLVVPWVGDITRGDLFAMVAEDYFYPILAGKLAVDVRVGNHKEPIDAGNVGQHTKKDRIKRLIGLTEWMRSAEAQRYEVSPLSFDSPEWAPEMFSEDMLAKMSDDFKNNRNIALKVNVEVFPKRGSGKPSYFEVAFRRGNEGDVSGPPCFVRDGIIILGVKSRVSLNNNILALVVAEHEGLAEFLGDSENPAHTDWLQSILEDKPGKYHKVKAGKLLNFVRDSVGSIVQIVTRADKGKNTTVLADIFPMPRKPDSRRERLQLSSSRNVQQFTIRQIESGFVVRNNAKHPLTPGAVLVVYMAYDIRGNSLNHYDRGDFLVQHLPLKALGMEVIDADGNEVRAKITKSEFSLSVSGFDKNRDIYIDVNVNAPEQKGETD